MYHVIYSSNILLMNLQLFLTPCYCEQCCHVSSCILTFANLSHYYLGLIVKRRIAALNGTHIINSKCIAKLPTRKVIPRYTGDSTDFLPNLAIGFTKLAPESKNNLICTMSASKTEYLVYLLL